MLTWCPFPFSALGIAFAICVFGRVFLGRTYQKSDGVPQSIGSFHILVFSAHFMAQAAIITSACVLPVALNLREALHVLGVFIIVQCEMVSTKLLATLASRCSPGSQPLAAVAQEPWKNFWLASNLAGWFRQHGLFNTMYNTATAVWFEAFVNMLVTGPLEFCGWGAAPACLLVGLAVGLLNHGAVSGLDNGLMATTFYVTMAGIFTVSHSLLPVAAAHSFLFFRQHFAVAVSPGFGEPLFLVVLLVNTAGILGLLGALSLVLPPALPLYAPQLPTSPANMVASPAAAFALASLAIGLVRLVVLSTGDVWAAIGSMGPVEGPSPKEFDGEPETSATRSEAQLLLCV